VKRWACALVFGAACAGPHVAFVPEPTGAELERAAKRPNHPHAELRASTLTIAPPSTMPARYLRTLEYNPDGYSAERTATNPASELLLGDLLFHSPRTLGPKAQALGISCHSCHPNGATHSELHLGVLSDRPGNVDLSSSFFRVASDDGVFNALNVPSLRGCRYTAPYGHDGRSHSLAEFVENVVHLEFDGAWLSPEQRGALVRYLHDLDFLPNRNLDQRNQLTAGASESARRGAAVFATPRAGFGGQSCASCHPPSSFFRDGKVHRLGSGQPPSAHAVDSGYETPSLLGLAESAPYFHDGRFARIADVVRWFDQSFSLALSQEELTDLVAYVESVGSVDRRQDMRPLALRLDHVFAYVSLLGARDERVNQAVLDEVGSLLDSAPPAFAARARAARGELEALAAERAAKPRAVSTLRSELSRLAADWAGREAARSAGSR
jgi:cytochrome c peroxidase